MLVVVAPFLDLGGRLAVDAGRAAAGGHGVAGRGALDAVALPRLAAEDENGDAREYAPGRARGSSVKFPGFIFRLGQKKWEVQLQ